MYILSIIKYSFSIICRKRLLILFLIIFIALEVFLRTMKKQVQNVLYTTKM